MGRPGIKNRFHWNIGDIESVDSLDSIDSKSKTYTPPESARNNARRVLKWREEHPDEIRGMTSVGWRRASQLASGKPISIDIVKRMAQFARHRKNAEIDPKYKDEPWRDAGRVAWLGWGGSSGIAWAKRISERKGKKGGPGSGWWGPPKGTHGEGSQGEGVVDFEDIGIGTGEFEEARKWGQKEWGSWRESLSRSEVEAIRDYVDDGGYREINGYLRTGYTQWPDEWVENDIDRIDSALEKSSITRDMVVYRGFGKGKRLESLNVGDVFSDSGFVSTALSRDVAEKWSGPVVARIIMRKGRKAAFLGGNWGLGNSDELEILLPRGLEFRVVERQGNNLVIEVV